jgi:hypothetical protein
VDGTLVTRTLRLILFSSNNSIVIVTYRNRRLHRDLLSGVIYFVPDDNKALRWRNSFVAESGTLELASGGGGVVVLLLVSLKSTGQQPGEQRGCGEDASDISFRTFRLKI